MYDAIRKYLLQNPWARERKNKNTYLAELLECKYNTIFGIGKDRLADLICDASTYDRLWRKVLQENPELRGLDYEEKTVLEQQKVLSLGYEMRYNETKKVMERL